MSKIGIFGGTFNPIHKGHISLVKQIKESMSLEKVILMPSCDPPHKTPVQLASDEDRLNMCKLATKNEKGLLISDLELKLKGKSYTINTIREIKKIYPDNEIVLIVGSDMIFSFDLWHKYEEILKMVQVAVGARKPNEYNAIKQKAKELGGNIKVCNVDVMPISSTNIRLNLAQELRCSIWLDEKVEEYIKTKGLYQDEEFILAEVLSIAKSMLKKGRFYHTQCVAKEAKNLALKYGENPIRAELAGVLHDILKNKSNEELLQILSKNGIILSNVEKHSPKIWHAIAGAIFCKSELNIKDAGIINAVRYHTTARAGMSLLEKIVYLADCISEDRDYDGIETFRNLAYENLDKAVLHSLKHTISQLSLNQLPISIDTLQAYNEFALTFEESADERR